MTMESVTETKWDVLIAGTGLPQSLLALALSRSDKKVLHVDKNEFYGGADAALTLQDAEDWVKQVTAGNASPFTNAAIEKAGTNGGEKLGFSRAYSLALSPQVIYTRSALLPTLVSSKVYRQLEFLAVGSWFVYGKTESDAAASLRKIPNSREDVFADKSLDMRAKRSLISFLRTIRDPDEQSKILQEHGSESLSNYLTTRHKLAEPLQSAVNALTLSPTPAAQTTVAYALPRIARHLASIGVFGPGFGAVIPKWGGLSELSQVACRAQAVGGGTYMLGKGIDKISHSENEYKLATLDTDTQIQSKFICGRREDFRPGLNDSGDRITEARTVSIVSANFDDLFASASDGGPRPSVAVVCFPSGSLEVDGSTSISPAYLMVHSSETGECPIGQCVVYSNMRRDRDVAGHFLAKALEKLLESQSEAGGQALWTLHFDREEMTPSASFNVSDTARSHVFADTSLDLAYSDAMLQEVRAVWQRVSGQVEGFMDFQDREVGAYDDDDNDL